MMGCGEQRVSMLSLFGRDRVRGLGVLVVVSVVVLNAGVVSAAGSAGAGWSIQSVARPTNFSLADNGACSGQGGSQGCDGYELLISNVGSKPTEGKVTITDVLPDHIQLAGGKSILTNVFSETETFEEWELANNGSERVNCSEPVSNTNVIVCTYGVAGESLPPGGVLAVRIPVEVTTKEVFSEAETLPNEATVEGGTAPAVSTSEPGTVSNEINGPQPGFGIQDFYFGVYGADGALDLQAGGHPGQIAAGFDLRSIVDPEFNNGSSESPSTLPAHDLRDVLIDLPAGFIGDPLAAATCSATGIANQTIEPQFGRTLTACPAASRIGNVTVDTSPPYSGYISTYRKGGEATALYNMVPAAGYPAEFGFSFVKNIEPTFAGLIRTPSGYRLRVAVPGIIRGLGVKGVAFTLFGDPATHDASGNQPTAFFSNPTACNSEPLTARVTADSWDEPGHWVSKESTAYPQITGCELLQFNPTIEVKPETTQADTPSGYEVDLKVPQSPNSFPNVATPDLKDAAVTLPAGVAVSPSAADGLAGCQATGSEGINIGSDNIEPSGRDLGDPQATELGAGSKNHSPYDDGLYHIAPGHCPPASQIGAVEVTTPLLAHPLTGRVFVAQPTCGGEGQPVCTEAGAEEGKVFGLYLEVQGSGVIAKLEGSVEVGGHQGHSAHDGLPLLAPGQVRTRFLNAPQLPFSDLKLTLWGGPRAPVANPQVCGEAQTASDLTPWSAPVTPDATPFSAFNVTGCAPSMSLNPGFAAGTVVTQAGGFSPFTATFSRQDGEQNLSGITVRPPVGLIGMISKVPLCSEPQAAQGTCGPESRIGTATAAAGAGSHPFYQSGAVYLTGPYKDAPFGLSVVVPAKAGPFNLGNIVVRAAISIDPHTSAITVTADPLPQSIDGVPLRLKAATVTIDRPEFMLNPTNCSQLAVNATVTGVLPNEAPGATSAVSTPFAVTGCRHLPFAPGFKVLTTAKTSRIIGASLHVVVTSGSGQASIAAAHVELPKRLPSRLKTLQKACPEATFAANPAACPPASAVGTATAYTPVLNVPLKGPAYLVSHGNAQFPDLVLVLQGQGVTIELTGNTHIAKGITTSTFNSVPDAPLTRFDLEFPQGPNSLLTATGSLCSKPLTMPTTLTAQNGAQLKQNTKITVTGCPKKHHKHKKHKK
jgi:hypothetical protein